MDSRLMVLVTVFAAAVASSESKSSGELIIHATTNTSVPSIEYVVDAVELLKVAYEIYPDDEGRAEAYLQLYENKHNETQWNVVTCYKVIKLNAKHFVELQVSGGGKSKEKSDKEKTDCLVMLFSV